MKTCEIDQPKNSLGSMGSRGLNAILIISGINMTTAATAPRIDTHRVQQSPTIEALRIQIGTGSLGGNTMAPQVNWSGKDVDSFEDVLSNFYNDLLKSQKPSNPIIEEALFSNLWDLYSFTDATPGQ